MDKKTIIAFVLSMLVILGYQYFYVKNQPPRPEQGASSVTNAPAEVSPSVPAPAPARPSPAASGPLVATEAPVRTVTVETPLYRAVFSSRGGTPQSWTMRKFEATKGGPVSLLREDAPGPYRALGIGIGDDFSLSDVPFEVRGGDVMLTEPGSSATLVFEYRATGRSITRTYTFHADTYKVDLADEVAGIPEYRLTLGTRFGIHDDDAQYTHVGPIILMQGSLEDLKAKDLKETRVYGEDVKWAALVDKYFCAALVPAPGASVEARAWSRDGEAAVALRGTEGLNRFSLYAGPKELYRLRTLGLGLEHIVDFGFFSPIARPIFWLLVKIHSVVGNYGWAIILLTIVIRIPFIPIVNRGQRSMKRMQEVQPHVKQLQEQYKKDPQRLNEEMMKLYKKHKVNPIGGCLPLVLQIPVFFALYKVLLIAIELRGAPWALWIVDLSQKDPYYVLPIVMGATMFIQQKLTPAAGDPRQQKIMMFMPLIFTFLFVNFASGLVLYWLVNNVLSIGQQLWVNSRKEAA
jgi:YidC/Oxa1 family membrane protein insertase